MVGGCQIGADVQKFQEFLERMCCKSGVLSEIILSGSPNLLKRLSCRSMAVPSQASVFTQGHKITSFERPRSTMTRIESYPSIGGRSVIRSMEQWAKGLVIFAPSIAW